MSMTCARDRSQVQQSQQAPSLEPVRQRDEEVDRYRHEHDVVDQALGQRDPVDEGPAERGAEGGGECDDGGDHENDGHQTAESPQDAEPRPDG
jgi:hypothetical protein